MPAPERPRPLLPHRPQPGDQLPAPAARPRHALQQPGGLAVPDRGRLHHRAARSHPAFAAESAHRASHFASAFCIFRPRKMGKLFL